MAQFTENFSYTNCNEVVKTDWTTVKVRIPIKGEDGETTYEFKDEPMVPFLKFSTHAKDVVSTEVIMGDYGSALVEFKTYYGGSFKYAIHRDCDCCLGDHPKLKDIMVVRLVKGEAARYTADQFSQRMLDEQNKLGNVCFKLIW